MRHGAWQRGKVRLFPPVRSEVFEIRRFACARGVVVLNVRPAVAPLHLVDEHHAAEAVVVAQIAVVGNPCVSVVVHNEFGVVPRSGHEVVAGEQCFGLVVEHTAAAFCYIRAFELVGAAVNHLVRAVRALAARAVGAEQVVIAVALEHIRAFHERACYLHFLCPRFYVQAVVGELNHVYSGKAAPDEVVEAVVLDEELVDGVVHALCGGGEDDAAVDERAFRAVGRGNGHAALDVALSPHAYAVVEHVLAVDVVDVGRPHAGALVARLARAGANAFGARGFGERRAHKNPVDEVAGAVNGHVVRVFRAIEVEEAVFLAFYYRGVGRGVRYDGVLVCLAPDVVVGCGGA